ncbi:BMC domain-containing protein [Lactococcus lactis]|uniref:BMC domain-containing protein n=1 Tax=Lactococcus lactis TaxID=1358 RepID=UPI00374D2089
MKALGMIETYGVIGAIEAADVMLKVADVSLIKKEKVQGGLQLITVDGDVGAVKVAVDAAASAVERLGKNLLFSAHVIPRPDIQLDSICGREDLNSDSEPIEQSQPIELVEDIQVGTSIDEIIVENEKADEEVYQSANELKTVLNKKRALDLKEMVMNNVNITLSEDEVQKMFKKELINLLLSDFRNQKESNNHKEEK